MPFGKRRLRPPLWSRRDQMNLAVAFQLTAKKAQKKSPASRQRRMKKSSGYARMMCGNGSAFPSVGQ